MDSSAAIEKHHLLGLDAHSLWSTSLEPMSNGIIGRFEGEVLDVPVFGRIPPEIDGTFYRIMVDPFYPLKDGNPPIEGDGNICAFRIQNGRVSMKTKYVETERLKLERKAGERLFGLYRNPFSHHPCVRAAIDSTANTNLVPWAGHLLALKESAQPYAIDPKTLETKTYDPFHTPGKTFTAHPKLDPRTNELVCFGYEAKGLATDDVVVFSLDSGGNVRDETWIKAPWVALLHDCAITENFVILVPWPFEANMERMKEGGQHWEYGPNHPATFIVVPRRASSTPTGWSPGEWRVYHWEHAILIHTAAAWEEDAGKLFIETSRVHYNPFPMFEKEPALVDKGNLKADYVCWEIDISQPSGTKLPEPRIVLDMPSEMARMDERFWTRPYDRLFCPVIMPEKYSPLPKMVPLALNGYVALNKKTGTKEFFEPGVGCTVEEPVFITRSPTAEEGDGWLLGMIQRIDINRSDLVVLDTKDISCPLAVVQLPFRTKGQIHGNWVDSSQ